MAQAYVIALRGQKQEDHEFENILGYIASLRPAWATSDPSHNKTKL